MHKGLTFSAALVLTLLLSSSAFAQFRGDLPNPYERTGQITTSAMGEDATNVFGLFDMQMNQSYEMTFGSFGGGNMYNQNILTNTINMRFNENLHGRVDVAMAHSPFGNSPMGQDQNFNFFIRNAELQYDFSDNSTIRLQFRQSPGGYNPYHRDPFGYRPYNRYGRW